MTNVIYFHLLIQTQKRWREERAESEHHIFSSFSATFSRRGGGEALADRQGSKREKEDRQRRKGLTFKRQCSVGVRSQPRTIGNSWRKLERGDRHGGGR